MTYEAIERAATDRHLRVLGGFHPEPEDAVPADSKTVILLGPDEPAFWPHLLTQPEYLDGAADPVDRWSIRVVGTWANELGAEPLFPFGGPPHLPFFKWATRTGRLHPSPILLLVHDHAGLFVSIRGALALRDHISLPSPPASPCITCDSKPCLSACPVAAISAENYNVPRCKAHITSEDKENCLAQGCAARRACPVSQNFGRLPEQSAYHMQRFLRP